MSRFTRDVRAAIESAGGYRIGIVRAVSTAEGLDVEIGGGLVTGLLFLNSYAAPGVGDVVAVAGKPGSYLVLDKIGTAGATLGPNLLGNPGFEFGLAGGQPSGWNNFWSTGSTGTVWLDDETLAHSSGATAEYEVGSLGTGQLRRLENTDAIPVDPGVVYRIGGWFRGSTADANTQARLTVVTAPLQENAKFTGTDSTAVDVVTLGVTADWIELSGTRTIPVGHNYMRVYPTATALAGHTAQYVYADDVSLRQQI